MKDEPSSVISVIKATPGNEDGLFKIFDSFEKKIDSQLKNALRAVAPELANRVRQTFDAKGKRGGNPAWLITRNPTPLIDTGALRKSIKGLVTESGKSEYVIVVGTDKDYAEQHNEGIGFPKREFLFWTDDDIEMVDNRINSALEVLRALRGDQ